jgi:hypothetical protein
VTGCTRDWYTASSGGTTVTGGYGVASFSPSITSSTTYYAQSRNITTGCVSTTHLEVTGTVNPVPNSPTMDGAGTHCAGAATITASYGSGGNGITWDDGTTNASRQVTATGSYWALTTSAAGCTSGTATVTVTIGTPSASGSAPNAACGCANSLTNCNNTCQASCGNFWTCTGFTEVTNAQYDGSGAMNWDSAKTTCSNKGSGWRLPKREELECMCANKATLPGGSNGDWYWSSTAGKSGGSYGIRFSDCVPVDGRYGNSTYAKCVK